MHDVDLYETMAGLLRKNEAFIVCTLIKTGGSTPRKAGAKMLVMRDGSSMGSIGGGKLESLAIEDGKEILKKDSTVTKAYSLDADAGMMCGGNAEVFFEPYPGKSKILIFGAGHVGKALVNSALLLGYHIDIIDERKEMWSDMSLSSVNFHCMDYALACEEFPVDENTHVVIVTHDHQKDAMILESMIKRDLPYLGMIGSRKKIAGIRKEFSDRKIATTIELDSVDMPIGLAIGAETPEEIAISIMASLIKSHNPSSTK